MTKLMIDGNNVYEIDEVCMEKKEREQEIKKKNDDKEKSEKI